MPRSVPSIDEGAVQGAVAHQFPVNIRAITEEDLDVQVSATNIHNGRSVVELLVMLSHRGNYSYNRNRSSSRSIR